MLITRIYPDKDGESHYEDVDISLSGHGPLGSTSNPIAVTSMIMRTNDPNYIYDWHVAPRKQYIVMLEGLVEIQVSDGETRLFKAGDIVLVEDTEGKGHKSHSPDGKPRRSLFLPIT
jgi:quercetin dioxygenase-like cupin family protein